MMIDAVPKFERLMNLVSFLLASAEPVPFSSIRKTVIGYNDVAREDAVEKRFDRDKKELREIGIPVEYIPSDEQGREGYYIPRDEYFHHAVDLTQSEATLLSILGNAARGGNDAVSSNLRAALLKMTIDSPVPEEMQEATAKSHVLTFSRGKRDRATLDNLERLVQAVVKKKRVKFRYRALGAKRVTPRAVHPYGLGYREGEWYVVGEDSEKGEVRQYKVLRIEGKVEVKKGRGRDFDVPAGFDIEKHTERGPWEFEGGKEQWASILFHRDVAWMVEENLTPARKFIRRKDGSGVLHLKVRNSPHTHQKLLSYLGPFSGQCAVIGPAWLRKQAMAHLKKLRDRYA